MKTPHPNSFKRCSRPNVATSRRMNARCTVWDAANPNVKRSRLCFSQSAAAGHNRQRASPRKAQRKRSNEMRAVVRIAIRIVASSMVGFRRLPQNIRQQTIPSNSKDLPAQRLSNGVPAVLTCDSLSLFRFYCTSRDSGDNLDCAAARATRPGEGRAVVCGGNGLVARFRCPDSSLVPLAAIFGTSAFPKGTDS